MSLTSREVVYRYETVRGGKSQVKTVYYTKKKDLDGQFNEKQKKAMAILVLCGLTYKKIAETYSTTPYIVKKVIQDVHLGLNEENLRETILDRLILLLPPHPQEPEASPGETQDGL